MADWDKVKRKYPDFARPFAAEMFCCYMLRQFSLEQADHIAQRRSPDTAVTMRDNIKRYFGIGNATGLGMAPYLINHPHLISRWIEVRETALARVLSQGVVGTDTIEQLLSLVARAVRHLAEIITIDDAQRAVNELLCKQMQEVVHWIEANRDALQNWSVLTRKAATDWSIEIQELINTLLIELYPQLVDDLEDHMAIDSAFNLEPEMSGRKLQSLIEEHYDWALTIDFTQPETHEVFWYRSQEKLEPRLGQSGVDSGIEKAMPLGIALQVRQCYDCLLADIASYAGETVSHFLLRHPEHLGITRRIQTMSATHYGDIRDNLLHRDVLPMHLLRCKLAFFGASKFDPRSRLWVRNTMYQGAPILSDIGSPFADNWQFPVKPAVGACEAL